MVGDGDAFAVGVGDDEADVVAVGSAAGRAGVVGVPERLEVLEGSYGFVELGEVGGVVGAGGDASQRLEVRHLSVRMPSVIAR